MMWVPTAQGVVTLNDFLHGAKASQGGETGIFEGIFNFHDPKLHGVLNAVGHFRSNGFNQFPACGCGGQLRNPPF
jgi:hypothetical protein